MCTDFFKQKEFLAAQKCKTQNSSSIHLGSESESPHSVTKSDYAGINTPQVYLQQQSKNR